MARSLAMPSPHSALAGVAQCLLLVLLTALLTLTLQWARPINPDVAFLAWTARLVLGPAVYGIDVYEVNPPLAFMLYTPAAVMSAFISFDVAIKLWVTALSCLSVAVFWQCCDPRLRMPLTVALAGCCALLFPGQFGQREAIAFLLTAPYAAGRGRSRSVSIVSGVMAGIGFAIKPYFLIPLALVFATRRRLGLEELAIAAVGLLYAISLFLFFQPYLFTFLPQAWKTYGSLHLERDTTLIIAGLILLAAIPVSLAGDAQPDGRGFIAATFGFVIAAFVQYKGFSYHFHAAWGFLVLLLVTRAFNARRVVAVCAVGLLLVYSCIFVKFTNSSEFESAENRAIMADLLREIDREPSFLFLAPGSFPAFPAALNTRSQYLGLAIWPIFAAAARDPAAGPEANQLARRLSFAQALRELQREPALVIVRQSQAPRDDPHPGLLAWLRGDAAFAALWKNYRYAASVDGYDLYHRN